MIPSRAYSFARLVGCSLLLLLAGCASGARQNPGVGATADRAATGVRLSPAEPAGAIAARCRAHTGDERSACYEESLLALLRDSDVKTVMEALERLAMADSDVQRDGHVYAHAIGIAAYESPETVGATYGLCTPSFQSGCYHGVIQAYFSDLGRRNGSEPIGGEAINALCADYRGDGGDRWLLFQCVHGMGHGLVMFYGHDLPLALEGCDLLDNLWEREGCYGGAIMENVVNATMPHHPAGALGHGGDHGQPAGGAHAHSHEAHGQSTQHAQHQHHHHEGRVQPGAHAHHEASTPPAPFRALDPDDPHYPCSVLDAKYQYTCYQMQTSAVLFYNGYDFAATARMCNEAPEHLRYPCYQSLGRDINAYTLQNHEKARELCAVGDPQYHPACHVGVAKNLVDLTARIDDGFAYCRGLTGERNRAICNIAMGEQIWILRADMLGREELCRQAEPGQVEPCRYGAGLTDERPAGAAAAR